MMMALERLERAEWEFLRRSRRNRHRVVAARVEVEKEIGLTGTLRTVLDGGPTSREAD